MGYCRPFKRGVSWRSQNFGANANNGTNGPGGHSGNDEACDIGSEVHAAGDGVVVYAGEFDDTYADNLLWLIDFGGNILVLDCGDNEPTFIYAHLSKFLVKTGDSVSKAQVIALSGNSGTRTTGPHCHNEAIPPGYVLNSPSLGRVNPDIYLTEWPEDIPQGSAGISPQGDSIKEMDWFDMASKQDLMDAFYAELKTPRTQQLIKDAVSSELGAVRTVKKLQTAIWTQVGGTRSGKIVSMWRDVVDTNTIVRTVLAAVQDISKKGGTDVAALNADAVVDALAARLDNSAKGGQ